MKRYAKVILGLMIALCCFGVFAACGGETDIVGTWKLNSVTVEGKEYKLGESVSGMGEIAADLITMEFKSDKTFTIVSKLMEQTVTQNGTWEKKDEGAYQLTAEDGSMNATLKDGILSYGTAQLTYGFKK